MFDKFCSILGHKRVHDVPEVFSVRHTSFRKMIWKVPHESFVFLHLRPKAEDRQFIVLGHVDSLDIIEFKQLLLLSENFFEEVFVHPVFKVSNRRRKTYIYSGGR